MLTPRISRFEGYADFEVELQSTVGGFKGIG